MLRLVFRLFSLVPLWVMYALSGVLWPVLYWAVGYRRGIVRRNLTESFPEMTLAGIKRLERKFYRGFTGLVFETVKMATISPRNMRRRMRFEGAEEIAETLAAGKKVSLYLGHVGNWEWVSSLPLHLPAGVRAGQVYHRLRNAAMDRLLLENRERMGAVCVEMHEVGRKIAGFDIMGYIADQAPQPQFTHHWVPFLNHRTPVYVGAEVLTKKLGAEPWYLDVRRVGRGRYEARFERLEYAPEAEYGITDAYYEHLERSIRRQPEIYLWTHNRFKHARRD
jgi:KDO2-lipid IV(A) lauroyltransferase